MLKKNLLLIFILLILNLNLDAKDDTQLQIVASSIDVDREYIRANGDVLIFSPNYYITAKKVIYNKLKQKLELFGNVNISKNNDAVSLSNYAFIDMKNEINSANPVLLIDKKSDIWIDARKIKKEKDLNTITNATLSSCDCYNPAWSLGFQSGDFNTTSQWINTYHNTLYFKDIPAWYFLIPLIPYTSTPQLIISYLLVNPPYIGFSTSNQRESGLLKPNIGYSKSQGYLYEQPIFFAPALNYDFEYIPKIRTRRGYGNELKYRYKDSINSLLEISAGKFKENDDYFLKENLINKEHYGWNLDYTKTKLLSNSNSSDALIISLQDMNDIEYKNTKYEQENRYSDKIIKSKIEYFYNTNSYFSDIHFEKYDNIFTQNNDEVFQTTPKLKIHKYTNKLLNLDNFTYSYDFNFHRKTKKIGIGANISEILIPISYSDYFFNNYLNISFVEQFRFKNINYTNDGKVYKDANYLFNTHILDLSTDLLKFYDNYIHTVNIGLTISKINQIVENGDLYNINNSDVNLSYFENDRSRNSMELYINQNIYSKESLKNIINYKISQSLYDNNNTNVLGNLENEIKLSFDNGNLFNRTYYNHDDKMIIKSTFAFDYKKDDFITNIDYSYSIDKNISTNSYKDVKPNKSITAQIGTKVLKYYTIKYKEQYDITNNISKIKELSLNINKKCWEFDFKLSDQLIASATNNQSARRQNTIYATITLKPLISIKQKYIQDEREE